VDTRVYIELHRDSATQRAIGAAIEVHRVLGPGLLDSAYEECFSHERARKGIASERQVPLPPRFKGPSLECGCRLDLIVEKSVVVELKTVERLLYVHEARLLTCLQPAGHSRGLLINFNAHLLKEGILRLVNQYSSFTP
jgi:GxxExxY protein